MQYRPGDVVNDHVLSSDGRTWRPLGAPPPAAADRVVPTAAAHPGPQIVVLHPAALRQNNGDGTRAAMLGGLSLVLGLFIGWAFALLPLGLAAAAIGFGYQGIRNGTRTGAPTGQAVAGLLMGALAAFVALPFTIMQMPFLFE